MKPSTVILGLVAVTSLVVLFSVTYEILSAFNGSLSIPARLDHADKPLRKVFKRPVEVDQEESDEEGLENDEMEVESAVPATEEGEPEPVGLLEAHKHLLNTPDMATLQARYGISDEERDNCVVDFLQAGKEQESSKSNSLDSGTIHDKLYSDIHHLALVTSCATSRIFSLYKAPHFSGGRHQFLQYFDKLGWEGTLDFPHIANRSAYEEVPENTVVLIAPCLTRLPFPAIHRRTQLVSMSPYELSNALKIPFYKSIRKLFDGAQCDYRTFHPESFLLENVDQCRKALQVIKSEPLDSQAVWFFKTTRDSFGDGVTVKTTETAIKDLRECSVLPRKLFIQRGVPEIMQYQGRASQGRAYFLISSYDPITVWLFLGYFNIAADPIDDSSDSTATNDATPTSSARKSAHVTNTRTNQKSARLLLHQFMKGRSREDLQTVKKHIKEAALTAFLALRPSLGENKGSYSMFGFDYLIQNDLNVKVLETNCNCELFINKERHGLERTTISTNLVRAMMDIVIASNLNPGGFKTILENYVTQGTENEELMKDDAESLTLDDPEHPIRRSWELLYSEAVTPPYSIMNFQESCVTQRDA